MGDVQVEDIQRTVVEATDIVNIQKYRCWLNLEQSLKGFLPKGIESCE